MGFNLPPPLSLFNRAWQFGTSRVKVIMHNTLALERLRFTRPEHVGASPNYWATLLWHKLMGTTLVDPKVPVPPNAYVYAQCLEGRPEGVTLLVINADRQRSFDLNLPIATERYTLTMFEDTTVELNGKPLRLTSSGDLPQLNGKPVNAGRVTLRLGVSRT